MLRSFARSPDVDRGSSIAPDSPARSTSILCGGPIGPGRRRVPTDVVSIFTALQEQLGLKLESRQEARDVVVIESVERPSPN